MGFCGPSGNDAQQARADEAARQARIKSGTEAIDRQFSGFNDNFYNQRAQAVFDANLPTLGSEYARTRNSLGYALAGRGLLNSSVRDQRENSLENEMAKQRRIIGDQGLSQANDLRSKVEDSRSRIYQQLLSSADPSQATAAATRESANLMTPSPVGALGNFFNDWSNVYLANKQAQASQPQGAGYSFGGSNKSSARIVGG